MTNLTTGSKYLLDGKQEVTIVKSFNKLSTKYVVETPSRSVILVETPRLRPLTENTVIIPAA